MRGRAALIGSLALVWSLSGAAQSRQQIPASELEDQVLGWIKVYDYPPATAPITVDTRVYSPAQLSIARLFANWMQASYLPKGALGDVLQLRNAKLSPYNQNTAAHPNAYGALAKLYPALMYDANKKIVPLTSDAMLWGIEANGFFGEPVGTISTPERTYFTLPTFEQQGYGKELDQAADVSRHPVLGQFPTRFVRNSASGNQRVVVLTKDRRLPFVTVTKGEYLQAVEAAVMRKYDDREAEDRPRQQGQSEKHRLLHGVPERQPRETGGGRQKQQRKVQEPPAGDGRDLDGRT